MRKMSLSSLLCILIAACTLEKPKKTSASHRMEEHNDSLSYAIGLDMGMRMELEYKNINHKMLNKGIDDYFSKNEYNLTDKERFRIIKKFVIIGLMTLNRLGNCKEFRNLEQHQPIK